MQQVLEVFLFLFQPFPKQALVFTCLQNKSFENTEVKGGIACHEQFLLFPTVFSTFGKLSAIFIKLKIVNRKVNHASRKSIDKSLSQLNDKCHSRVTI